MDSAGRETTPSAGGSTGGEAAAAGTSPQRPPLHRTHDPVQPGRPGAPAAGGTRISAVTAGRGQEVSSEHTSHMETHQADRERTSLQRDQTSKIPAPPRCRRQKGRVHCVFRGRNAAARWKRYPRRPMQLHLKRPLVNGRRDGAGSQNLAAAVWSHWRDTSGRSACIRHGRNRNPLRTRNTFGRRRNLRRYGRDAYSLSGRTYPLQEHHRFGRYSRKWDISRADHPPQS